MKSRLIVTLLAVLTFTPRAGVAQGLSLAEMPPIDTTHAKAPEQWIARGHELYAASRYREAIAAFERGLQLRADRGADGAWNVSRAYAQLGNRKQALRWLTHARQMGFQNEQAIRSEPAFDKYRDDALFRALVIPSSCTSCRSAPRNVIPHERQRVSGPTVAALIAGYGVGTAGPDTRFAPAG